MFCPLCKAEYREGFTRCADCDVELVPVLERADPASEQASEEEVVLLWRGDDPVLFSALTAALQEAGIPFHEYASVDYANWLSAPRTRALAYAVPNLDVRVLKRNLAEAEGILRDLEAKQEGSAEQDASSTDAQR